jgi:modification methylase
VPGIVLDPFVGTGTTVMAAKRLHRSAVGVDLNPAYLRHATQQLRPT